MQRITAVNDSRFLGDESVLWRGVAGQHGVPLYSVRLRLSTFGMTSSENRH